MDRAEARWIRAALNNIPAASLSPLLNIGSSTQAFRTCQQPWIEEELLAPLRARGVVIVHNDIKSAEGVDIVASLLDDDGFARLKAVQPAAVLCSNVLEHVPDAGVFARRIEALLAPGGIALISGPHSYPYHRDPIDTMFRPTPVEAAALFGQCQLVQGAIVDSGLSYRDNIRARPWIIMRHVLRAPFPMFGLAAWKRSMRKLGWLFVNYSYYAIVLCKQAVPQTPEASA
jgi:SAM-dependent methyltransferase